MIRNKDLKKWDDWVFSLGAFLVIAFFILILADRFYPLPKDTGTLSAISAKDSGLPKTIFELIRTDKKQTNGCTNQ